MNNTSFPEPTSNEEVCICQVDGRLYFGPPNTDEMSIHTKSVDKHPKINVNRDMCHLSANRDELNKYIFRPIYQSLIKRLVHTWYEQGFLEALNTAANPRYSQPKVVVQVSNFLLKIINTSIRIKEKIQPTLHGSGTQFISQISKTRDWITSPIRCIAWHPHCMKIAVATFDDMIRIYNEDTSMIPVLKCKSQKRIMCMEWRPLSSSELAVGCENGIVIWTIDPCSVVTRPSSSNTVLLESPGHSPVVSLSWSPVGDLLASSAVYDSSVCVWDVSAARHATVKRAAGGGVCLVRWAPDGQKLFSSSALMVFRIWDCNNWTTERWTVGSGRVQAACFSPCSTVVLFCTDRDPYVFALRSNTDGVWACNSDNCASKTAQPVLSVHKNAEEHAVSTGGPVCDLAWDGCHLAVMFKETNSVAVYNTMIDPVLQFSPCCTLSGSEFERPCAIAFQPTFKQGCCLTVGWSSGRIQYFPIVSSALLCDQTDVRQFADPSSTSTCID